MRYDRLIRLTAGALLGAIPAGYGAFKYYEWLTVHAPAYPLISSPLEAFIVTTFVSTMIGVGAAIGYALADFEDIAVIDVDHTIERDATGAPDAAAVVEAIETADADEDTRALLVRLNTPGGEVLASDEIREAVAAFDGPTVAVCQDVCASGGYLIAAACDRIYAHEMSHVGSIGVLASKHTMSDLVDRLGVEYERFVGGEMKDAGMVTRGFDDEEREYVQSEIVDSAYAWFVEQIAADRPLSQADVLATKAKVFTGETALERGLIDALGTEDDAREYLADRLDLAETDAMAANVTPSTPSLFTPSGIAGRVTETTVETVRDRFSGTRVEQVLLKR